MANIGASETSDAAAREKTPRVGALKKTCAVASQKFVVLINPKLLAFSRPFLLALIIGGVSFILFGMYSGYLLSQCHRQSFTTTTRSEMIQWFDEESSLDPMNHFHKNWKCLHYTAKLVSSNGILQPEIVDHDQHEKHCASTGECDHRVTFKASASTRYEKCDIGTVRYKTEDGFELQPPGTPENAEVSQDFIWVAAHDLRQIPGGIEEANEILRQTPTEKTHPMYRYLTSKPYLNFNRQFAQSEDMHDFDIKAPENQLTNVQVDTLLQEPSRLDYIYGGENGTGWRRIPLSMPRRVRSRSKGGGEFPYLCPGADKVSSGREAYAKQLDVGTRRRRTDGEPGKEYCNTPGGGNLTQNVLGFEFKLVRKGVAMPAYDASSYKNELNLRTELPQFVKESRHLKRSMFCNPADYDDVVMYRGSLWTDTIDSSFACDDKDSENWDDPRCTLVHKCDLTGLPFNSEPGVNIEPTEQPEYGSFLAVYEVCPPLLDTLGTAFGFLGQIEMFITVLVILLSLSCGCVAVHGDDSVERPLQQRVVDRIKFAIDIAAEEQNEAIEPAVVRQRDDSEQPGEASVPLSPHADASGAGIV